MLDTLEEAVERFEPELVICSRPNFVDPGGRIAWVELSIDSTRASKVCVGGRYSESTNPTLEVLLTVIDEVEGSSSRRTTTTGIASPRQGEHHAPRAQP